MANFPISPQNDEIYEDSIGRWKFYLNQWHRMPKVHREEAAITPIYSNLSNLVSPITFTANNQIFSYGQSLSKGVSPGFTSTITPFQPYNSTTFKRGVHSASWRSLDGYDSLIPLTEEYLYIASESATYVETPCSGTLNTLHKFLVSNDYPSNSIYPSFHISAPGIGGATIDSFTKPGNNRYPILIDEISAYRSLINNTSQHSVPFLSWMQGENDYLSGTSQNSYYNKLVQLANDFSADTITATGQSVGPQFLTYQISSHNYYSSDPVIALAQLQASTENNIHLVSPMYIFPYADDLHLTPEGYYWYGMYVAKVANVIFNQGKKWTPLKPTTITKSTNSCVITYSVPYGSLSIDSLSRPIVTDYGFECSDGSGSLTIVSIVPQNGNQFLITFNRSISGTLRVKYGWDTNGGNVRDQDYTHFYLRGKRYNLYNWSVIFDITA